MNVVSTSQAAQGLAQARRRSADGHPNLAFWLNFLALNWLLFLPLYLFNRETSRFWPALSGAGAQQLLLWRNNLDIFRLSLEVAVLAALWVNLPPLWRRRSQRVARALFAVFYGLAFGYAVYENISLSLYQIDPVFYAQYRLATDGVPFVIQQLRWPWGVYAVGLFVVALFVGAVWSRIRALIGGVPPAQLSRGTKGMLAALALWAVLAPLATDVPTASPKAVVSSFSAKLAQNVAESLTLRRKLAGFDAELPYQVYNYSNQKLLQKPDIYLIFVESYGSVLTKRPWWRQDYEALLRVLQEDLRGEGWQAATALSESPTWGGGSWLAYTSALCGLRVDNHAAYLSLVDSYQEAAYPDLGRALQAQGYRSVFVTSISRELGAADRQRYANFYGVDEWVDYSRLRYNGPKYGWGSAPPDQYVLWYWEKELRSAVHQPTFFFYLTQNSHYPWLPLPELAADWQTLNQPAADPSAPLPEQVSPDAKRRNYLNAVEYQLRFLTDFIRRAGRENAIYVLIGDHQPQQVSRRADSFATPVHIISRDAAFVQALAAYGFVDGLVVPDMAPAMRHEGLYSLLMRTLLAVYGQGNKVLPPFLPNGIVME